MKYKFTKQKEAKIMFGIMLPDIIYDLFSVAINESAIEDILRTHLNISKDRLIKLVEAVSVEGNEMLILVIYDKILSKGQFLREKMKIEESEFLFNFNIYKYDFNKPINVEFSINLENQRKELKWEKFYVH